MKKLITLTTMLCFALTLVGCSASMNPTDEQETGTSAEPSVETVTKPEAGVATTSFDYATALADYTPYVTGEPLDADPMDVQYAGLVGVSSEMIVNVLSSGNILAYFSFDTQEWTPFCSKSGCTHDSQLCNAYLGSGSYGSCMQEGTEVYYFAVENGYKNLYLMKFDIQNQQYSQVCEVTFEEEVSAVDLPTCYYEGEYIYFVTNLGIGEMATEADANCRYMVCLNWKTGEVALCEKLPDDFAGELGYYDGKLLILANEYVSDDVLTEEEYYAQYGEQGEYYWYLVEQETQTSVQALDLKTGERITLVTFEDDGSYDYVAHWALYGEYFLLAEQNQVTAYSIFTGEKQDLFTGSKDYVYPESIIDRYLFYIESTDGEMTHCIYDLTTGNGYELGPHNGEGNPFFGSDEYYVQENMQCISKTDYLSGNWDGWISLAE